MCHATVLHDVQQFQHRLPSTSVVSVALEKQSNRVNCLAISNTRPHVSKIATIFCQKDSRSFQQWVQRQAKRSYLQDYEGTDTRTDCYNPPPTLGLNRLILVMPL